MRCRLPTEEAGFRPVVWLTRAIFGGRGKFVFEFAVELKHRLTESNQEGRAGPS